MKTIFISFIAILVVQFSFAQEPADALRLSRTSDQGGTARNQAIGGAGASLGGEFTSLFINPAGLGFYKTGDFVFTPSYSLKNNKSGYLGKTESASKNNFNLGATGFVFAMPSENKKIKSVAIGIGYRKVADFNNYVYYKGTNTKSSYSEKYLEELIDNNATDPNKAQNDFPYTSSLAIRTYLVDPTYNADSTVSGYSSQANPAYGLIQENTIRTSGGISELSLGGAVNVKDKWYFGGTLTVPFIKYDRQSSFKESDASGNLNNRFNYFEAGESLNTTGIGINLKLGMIYKPVEYVRLGLAIHTPTYYELTDNYSTSLVTDLEGYGGAGLKQISSLDLTDGQPLVSKYSITTPWKFIGSASYVFREVQDVRGQRAFITADVEYLNYKGSAFHATSGDAEGSTYYGSVNKSIDNLYKNAINVKVGGEVKFNTLMFRLGGAYYGNPYQNESASITKISGGLGYRNRGMFLDLTYVYSLDKDINYPYQLNDKPNSPASLRNTGGNIFATLGFKF
ncbi:MAG: aromatic hydrocarbon degradation protein [Ginsengibacter sp.]